MTAPTIGFLHPGAMGSSVAAAARSAGAPVLWASDGRSEATRERAERAGLTDAGQIVGLCQDSDIIFSICPPDVAEALADTVIACGFSGIFVDANAVAPARARRIAVAVVSAGARYVDGGIIGPPAERPGTTCLYLSGQDAPRIAQVFDGSMLQAQALDATPDRASALKMCYAAQTKGLTALLCAQLAAADALGVGDALLERWRQENPATPDRTVGRVREVTAKAWRFAGEMEEIAATMESVDLPGGFHLAAADIYRRLAGFKAVGDVPDIETVLAALVDRSEEPYAPLQSAES